jgi:hypothetical protein
MTLIAVYVRCLIVALYTVGVVLGLITMNAWRLIAATVAGICGVPLRRLLMVWQQVYTLVVHTLIDLVSDDDVDA